MTNRYVSMIGVVAISATSLFADFSYRESTKITGGAMAGMMKVAGVFSKAAREPMDSTVALKGNKLAHRGANHMSLIDLDARTITTVEFQKKQYSVLTFEEMKQALDNMAKKMKKDANMNVRVSAEPTGKTKEISGFNAKEIIMKVAMDVQNEKNKQSGSMVVITDIWFAEDVPGYSEVAAFYKKMAEQLNWTPGGGMFAQQPEISKGMAEAFKEVSKMNGTPVYQKMVMGPEGIAPPSSDGPAPAAQQEQKPKPSVGSALGGALGGRFGLGRKKQEPAQEQPQQQQAPQQASGAPSMIEMETTYSGFSTTADASLLEIPAGFKQVESEMKKIK